MRDLQSEGVKYLSTEFLIPATYKHRCRQLVAHIIQMRAEDLERNLVLILNSQNAHLRGAMHSRLLLLLEANDIQLVLDKVGDRLRMCRIAAAAAVDIRRHLQDKNAIFVEANV